MSKYLSISLIIVAFVLGLGGGYLISPEYARQSPHNSMQSMSDEDFIVGMIEHHMGAVEMAKEAKEKSKRQEIIFLANNIISAQEKEIEILNRWRKDWYNNTTEVKLNQGNMHNSMMMDLGEANSEFDLRFINAMVDHHAGAIGMAQSIKTSTNRKEVTEFANDIIKDQAKEINQMLTWKSQWYQNSAILSDSSKN